MKEELSKATRTESDLIGELKYPKPPYMAYKPFGE